MASIIFVKVSKKETNNRACINDAFTVTLSILINKHIINYIKEDELFINQGCFLSGVQFSMSVPSMVHRSGISAVRNAVSGDAFHEPTDDVPDAIEDVDVVVPPAAAAPPAANNDDDDCDRTSSSKELPDCKVRRNYTCTSCDFFTQNPRIYLYHLRDVHRQKIKVYECPNCLYASKHFQKLLRHSRMVHGTSEGVTPTETSRKSRRRSNENDHLEDVAAENGEAEESFLLTEEHLDEDVGIDEMLPEDPDRPVLFKCSVCAFTSRNRAQLGKHEREEHIKTKFFRCSKCTYVTHIKARYTKHVKYHSMPMIKCDMCDFRTPYKWNLDRHCKNHNGKGAFRCSACNFTADIKQSLTVHEMNHHVPPVGQAAGLGIGRRRNKVGASDTTAAEEAAHQEPFQIDGVPEVSVKEEPQRSRQKTKTTSKKSKVTTSACSTNGVISEQTQGKLSEFIHPDDIVQHSNGKVYIKNKCKLCNYKTAWDSEMAKHEKHFHNIDREINEKKKTSRPIPNLIPLNQQRAFSIKEPMMSQKDINDICRRSANSALKDFAPICGSEDVFKSPSTSKVPDLIPTSIFSFTNRNKSIDFKQKNASFFDRLKEKLEINTGCNLMCSLCGHESKCLTEQAKHQKICGKELNKVPNIIPVHNISASRCQYCRQRCKSSADLYNHLQTCAEAIKMHSDLDLNDTSSEHENELKIDEDRHSVDDEFDNKPHPMENKVFVWNDIMVPMDIDVDDSNYEYTEDKLDDNGSLDLSIRTHSPVNSENSYIGQENNNSINTNNNLSTSVQHSPVQTTTPSPLPPTEKIPTHGNDISVAQHKRVFKCPHCTFWASTASRFHVHIVGHLNKKPFECSLCSYRSNWRWDITKHIKLKSVRDQAHESAKVLMTDETGRRNYTKYNKYLTEIPLSSLQSSNDTSGGSGTRPKSHDRNSSPSTSKSDKKFPTSGDVALMKVGNVRSPPGLTAADKQFLANVTQEKKRSNSDSKRTLFKCKKCNFRNASREILLQHVKGHYQQDQPLDHHELIQQAVAAAQVTVTPSPLALVTGAGLAGLFSTQDLSLRGTSPDRDERHCRLKHSGDIRVVSTKNGEEKLEVEEQLDDSNDMDILQPGSIKCEICPYTTDNQDTFQTHLTGHLPQPDSAFKCIFCNFSVADEKDVYDHVRLHEISNSTDADGKKFRCVLCPYVTNSKSQYTYHKQFHKDRGGQYTCSHCSYNVSKRHLLHQHLKVHGINVSLSKQNGNFVEVADLGNEAIIDDTLVPDSIMDLSQFADIPLVWVSKNGKFSKMFKCRYCPHVNLRKVNIHEHEKMHTVREKNPNSSRMNEVEHRCPECSYLCNNAGVLSSHSKVHQGLYGIVHCLVDLTKSDEEQIRELTKALGSVVEGIDTSEFLEVEMEEVDPSSEKVLYFCKDCPARFLKENEFVIHRNFHNSNLQYKCNLCSYAADNESYLMSHLKIHATEYQERSNILKSFHSTSPNHPEPELRQKIGANGEIVWGVDNTGKSELEQKNNILASFLSKPLKSTVPLSGTDLFQQRSEAQQRQNTESDTFTADNHAPATKIKTSDPQFGSQMHGNPEFIYQTYIKNGRTKEKRYKCHKCPSAFEKREQYKIHLGLHGSQQRYNCDSCDYSVKYYANFVQHLKKHKFNEDAQAAKKGTTDENDEIIDESMEVTSEANTEEYGDVSPKLTLADQQMLDIMQERNSISPKDKNLLWCEHCPYVASRKDALENHQKRHECVSGLRSAYACEHCDYTVPQAHYLRDHTKIHFLPNKTPYNQVNGYMTCDNLKLTSKNLKASEDENEEIIYEDVLELNNDEEEKFNNNKGEKRLINVQTGDLVVKKDVSDLKVEENNLQMGVN
ncbi:unnamed protein product [Ceutorhynchus assimilis]|uniref:C2H2-type domain-containing protein n=1 Tax=Ceutorhynchus assimilis TaxID=467358 RepID=A0A9P0DEY7_9CUCU|nr:unnamed protein product [Ceutorhynchus assimilis]